jgi:hypothetical protein
VTLEILHLALMLLRGLPGFECPEIFALMGPRIDLSRIETIFAGFQLADHGSLLDAINPLELSRFPDVLPRWGFTPGVGALGL